MFNVVDIVTSSSDAAAVRKRVADDEHVANHLSQLALVILTDRIDIGQCGFAYRVGVFCPEINQAKAHQVSRVIINNPQVYGHSHENQPHGQDCIGYFGKKLSHNRNLELEVDECLHLSREIEYQAEDNEIKSSSGGVTYTDLADTIVALSGSIMDAITYVLVGFSSISLIVS